MVLRQGAGKRREQAATARDGEEKMRKNVDLQLVRKANDFLQMVARKCRSSLST